jgi:two-component system sensor histidine kinase YesM
MEIAPIFRRKPKKIRKTRVFSFRNISISYKLLTYFLIVSLTPVTILGAISFISSRTAINRKVTEYSFRGLEQATMNLQNKINAYRNICLSVVVNREGNNLLKGFINNPNSSTSYALSEFLKVYLTGDLDIYGCLFIPTGDQKPFYYGALILSGYEYTAVSFLKEIRESPFFAKVLSSGGRMVWSPPLNSDQTTDEDGEIYIIAACTVNDLDTGEVLGAFGILTKVERIDKIINLRLDISHNPDWHNNYSLVIDDNKTIIACPLKENIGKSITQIMDQPQLLDSLLTGVKFQDSFYTFIDDREYLITGERVEGSNWYLLNLASTSFLYKESKMVGLITLFVGVAFTTLAVLISLLFTFNITKPLKTLIGTMSVVEKGDLSVRFKVKQEDEIGRLGKSFNQMINKLDNLVNIVYASQLKEREVELKLLQAQIRKREIELNALQAQINPHFLYNTLESLRRMADLNGDHDTSKMVLILGKLLRYTVQIGNQTVSILEEMEYLQNYLALQNLRFKNKFELVIDLDPRLSQLKIIKLIFQPLIENSIYHGLESKAGLGTIGITGKYHEQGTYFEVADDGVGINRDHLEQINRRIKEPNLTGNHGKSIGLKNVNERIKLHYGDEYGIEISSEPGQGTIVRIKLPGIDRMNEVVI